MRQVTLSERTLPGIGKVRELRTGSGDAVIVVVRSGGGCDVALRRAGEDEIAASVSLDDPEAVGLAAILTGALVAVEIGGPEGSPS